MVADEELAEFETICDEEEGCGWRGGDRVNRTLAAHRRASQSKREWKIRRRKIIGAFAQRGQKTVSCVAQRAAVSATFGWEQRPDHLQTKPPWHFYRSVMNAATRTKVDPRQLLDDALAKGLTVADLNAMGKDVPQVVALAADCSECGATVRVKITGTTAYAFKTWALRCPVCVAKSHRDEQDGCEAQQIGTLEAA